MNDEDYSITLCWPAMLLYACSHPVNKQWEEKIPARVLIFDFARKGNVVCPTAIAKDPLPLLAQRVSL